MALLTGGTNANSSLSALLITRSDATTDIQNKALVSAGILDDLNVAHPIYPGAFMQGHMLYVPNRGVLRCLTGDYVMFDATTGWPILVSARAIAAGPWAHS
jgi:hypothetical protein